VKSASIDQHYDGHTDRQCSNYRGTGGFAPPPTAVVASASRRRQASKSWLLGVVPHYFFLNSTTTDWWWVGYCIWNNKLECPHSRSHRPFKQQFPHVTVKNLTYIVKRRISVANNWVNRHFVQKLLGLSRLPAMRSASQRSQKSWNCLFIETAMTSLPAAETAKISLLGVCLRLFCELANMTERVNVWFPTVRRWK